MQLLIGTVKGVKHQPYEIHILYKYDPTNETTFKLKTNPNMVYS